VCRGRLVDRKTGRGDGRGRRLADATERLVDRDHGDVDRGLGLRDRVLGIELGPLGLEQRQVVGDSLAVLDVGELGCAPRRIRLLA